jgi:hypothetical protein
MRPIRRPDRGHTILALLLLAVLPCRAGAQSGTLVGRVLDAGTRLPVPAAVVTLEPAAGGLIVDARGPVALTSVRTIVTGDAGAYRFTDIVPGRYRLRVERLGYHASTVEVDVRRPVEAALSIGLELAPVALEPVRVDLRAAALFHRAVDGPAELDEARVAAERLRQTLFVAPDARMLTYADVMDGVTLGEGDVFRALQRFPGVGTRDDYTAELWTRGAPWTHTRVTFDGVPLMNPVHAVGVLSAITPEVLGAAFFHPGVRPAAISDGAAGIVDLRSRSGGGAGELRGLADLSMASAKLVLDQNINGRGAWVLAARRSHLGVLTHGLGSLGLDTVDLPYVFHDLAGRADVRLGARTSLEASGLWEQDRIEGDVEGIIERTTARWGNAAGRITLRQALGGLELSHTLGASVYAVRTDDHLVRTREPVPWTEPASRNEIEYLQLAGQLSATGESAPRWSVGYEMSHQRGLYDGPLPRYYAVKPDTVARLHFTRALVVGALWGDARFALGPHVTFNPALRAETGDAFADAPRLRLAPRMALRITLSQDQSISIAAGRSWQYLQAIALAGPSIHPAFHASHFWVWPNARTPAIRSDLLSLGSERWLGRGWLASANAYTRTAKGVALPDPDTGALGRRRPLYVIGANTARGLELNLRRVGAQWSASFGYTYGRSQIELDSDTFPASADRRHVFDAMVGVRIAPMLRVAAAYTAMSGAPFTRAYAVTREDCMNFGFHCNTPDGAYVQAPNAERTPPYRSLDAALQWAQQLGPVGFSAYFQVRNVLDRDNASTYAGSRPIRRFAVRNGVAYEFEDRFEQGLPRLPLVGVRLTF